MKKILLLLLGLSFVMSSAQNIFEKDPNWNTYELPNNQYYVDGFYFVKSEVQSDGKLIVAVTNYSSIPTTSLVRLDGNQRDTSFLSGNFNGLIKDFLIQPDGKIVVVGAFTTYEGIAAKYMVRLNPDGTRDNSFVMGNGFTIQMNSTYTWAGVVKIQPDGKLLVGGDAIASYNGQAVSLIVRINADGSPDPTFVYDPAAYKLGVHSIAIQPDGKIIIGDNGRIYRTLANGTLDPSWTRNTPQASQPTFISNYADREIRTIVVLPNGKILVGGEFEQAFNSSNRRDLVRLNADGSLDPSFYGWGFRTVTNSRVGVSSIVVLADGKIIIGGDFTRWSNDLNTVISTPKCILRLNSDGTLDSSFTAYASFSTDYNDTNSIKDIKMTSDGKLVCVGSINSYNGVAVNNIVRIDTDGNRDTTFHNICKGFNDRVGKILQQPNGKILVSGRFSMYNGSTRDRLVRLNEDGSVDESFEAKCYQFIADYNQITDMALQADGKILITSSGMFFFNGQAGGSFVRLNSDGSLDTSFVSLTPGDYGLYGSYTCVRVQPDGKILTVGRTGNDNVIKRFNPDRTLDTTFNFTTYTNCNEVALQPDGKILFSYYTGWGVDNYKMGRLLPDGQIDTSFNPPTTTPGVTNFTLQPDGKVLCFSDVTGGHSVFRLNANGSLDTGFSFPSTQSFQSENTAHALLPDGKILMGVRLVSVFPNYLVRRNPDGSADTTFNIGSGFAIGINYGPTDTEYISDIDIDSYGRILVGGTFRLFNGQPENAFVRLRPEGFLSTPDITEEGSFVIYPNPVKDTIHISTRKGKTVDRVSLFSLSGNLIMSVSDTNIDVSFLENGFYIIKISSGNEIEQFKIIKN
ncbi:hypothetical protein FLJC2902T_13230 [Flavobacterium limnosediminis JC2902]|uniref:Secretion system C-terminal sorting domain-containing protein n=1 Tax=Flavobacterium limnosediminis JC2902 TaxID=1341181 RepID=V6SQK7_9FLAO|nr:T9SS type A sorting domain-containing protein [Flavobacterium limnosediminis]ESU28729.1 hypothetical protein FLJC2902T_13230 [Flavobacterium limnosediminis JC2902]